MINGLLNSQCNKDFNMNIIDAHTHIDYITNRIQPNVESVICCSVCEDDWENLINIINSDKNVYGAFGIHPWHLESIKDGWENRLYDLLNANRNFMVGEIGLDKYKPNMEKQISVFTKQLEIAIRLKRNVFLHCVGAWDKIFQILKRYKRSELPLIIAHGFNGSDEILHNLLNNYNVMISFSKINKDLDSNRIQEIDINKILIETDGKSDINLSELINTISEIKNNTDIPNIIYNNTKQVLQNG